MDKLSVAGVLGAVKKSGETYKRLLERTDFDLGIYRPRTSDEQAPHARDEIYIIASGMREFVCAGERETFRPGDVFFVAAGAEHRFGDFSNDFATWVIFLGARTQLSEATNLVKLMCIIAVCVGFSACAPNAAAPPSGPTPSEARMCPADGYLDCMPIVPAERRTYCAADYRNWIVHNCPNVELVY